MFTYTKYASLLLILLSSCSTLVTRETQINVVGEKRITVLHISDIHYKKDETDMTAFLDKVNSQKADITVFTGDLFERKADLDGLIEELGKIKIKKPMFAVMGNWEYGSKIPIDTLRTKLGEIGIVLLINEEAIVSINNENITIYGIDDYVLGKPNWDGLLHRNEIDIVLSHCPIMFDEMNDNRLKISNAIMISGHTHGGQITIFGLPLYLPPGSGKYVSGIYKNGNNILYVSRGVGYSRVNIRLFSNPTIEVLDLQ